MFGSYQAELDAYKYSRIGSSAHRNRLRWVLSYDACGNLKTYADWEYEWEAGHQLVKQTQNEKVVSYDYDYNGM